MDFYCNPRLQAAVVMKITVEGLNIVRKLCAENIEKYVHYDEINDSAIWDDTDLLEKELNKCYNIFIQKMTQQQHHKVHAILIF